MSKVTFQGKPVEIKLPGTLEPGAEPEIPKGNTEEMARVMSGVFNERTSQRHYINEVRFSFYNHKRIVEAFDSGRAVDLTELPKRHDRTALIIGSGPTLDEALPLLADWKNDIICSTSHAPTLLRWGIVPDYVVALDPDSHPDELAAPGDWADRKTVLIMHPGINPDMVNWWNGKMAIFRKLQPQTPWYANELALGYAKLGPKDGHRYDGDKAEIYIKAQVPMLACVTAAQICIGKHLGYHQMYLVGCDNSYPGNKTRFTSSRWTGKKWEDVPAPPLSSQPVGSPDPVIETELNGLRSSPMLVFYSHQVVVAWRITETDIVNTSNKGLLRMFPYTPLEEVIKKQKNGVKAYNVRKIREVAEEHLARQNIYFLWVGKGVMPQEFKDPLHEIPKLIDQLEMVMKQKGREKDFDADANRKRIQRLFNKMAKYPSVLKPAVPTSPVLGVPPQTEVAVQPIKSVFSNHFLKKVLPWLSK